MRHQALIKARKLSALNIYISVSDFKIVTLVLISLSHKYAQNPSVSNLPRT